LCAADSRFGCFRPDVHAGQACPGRRGRCGHPSLFRTLSGLAFFSETTRSLR